MGPLFDRTGLLPYKKREGWVPCFMPVIPAPGRPRQEDHFSPGVRDQPGQHSETLSLQKIQKLTGHGAVHLWSQLLGRLRQEDQLSLGS